MNPYRFGYAWLVLGVLVSTQAMADNWSQWRGPTADGLASASAQPPLEWSTSKNLRWVAEIPGQSAATPIIWNDQVFVVAAEKTDRQAATAIEQDARAKTLADGYYYRFRVTSIDRQSGKQRWEHVATEQVPHEGRHPTNTYAAGSPTTDGERLYVSFGSRGIYAYTLDGQQLWQVDLGDMRTRFGWGEAVTPVLAGELLIINWDQEAGSFMVALDKRTGREVWRTERQGEVTSWNTPLVTTFNGKTFVIANGTESVKAYDAATGQLVWSCGGQTTNAIPSPLRFEDAIICMSGYQGAYACSIPLASQGDVTNHPSLMWQVRQGTPYVPSPTISRGRLFFTSGNSDVLSCVDAKTGKTLIQRRRIPEVGSLYASPMVANGHIYFTGREGTTTVLKDNANLDVAAINRLEDAIDASPVAVDGQLFLRSWSKLYCIDASP